MEIFSKFSLKKFGGQEGGREARDFAPGARQARITTAKNPTS